MTEREIAIVKADGNKELFEPEKLRGSILRSGASEEAAEGVLSQILPELHDGMTTGEIYQHAFSLLQQVGKPLARSYSLRRALMELGPSGFPFEDFVAEVLRSKGFECVTRQTVLGACVPHEMDVVAWNKERLLMVEAKFHNELGTKSDLKVALYIKARFDDIKDNLFDYGGSKRQVTDCWLVTNTKFSSTAIHYGLCKNLTMIGWNYPEKGNLQDMVESEHLHPITCLSSLSASDKKILLARGVVLCSTIKNDPSLLKEFLGANFNEVPIIKEIKDL